MAAPATLAIDSAKSMGMKCINTSAADRTVEWKMEWNGECTQL